MSYIITDQQVTVFGSDGPFTAARNEISNWDEFLEALKTGDFDRAIELASPRKLLDQFFLGADNVTLNANGLMINGQLVDSYPAYKAIEFAKAGLPYIPIVTFVHKLQGNPSYRAVRDLFEFLEASQMPLTASGDFIAYKKVRREGERLVDIYSGQFDNSPGQVVEMPRNQVDEDPDSTCSAGLHVCSHSYLPHFGSNTGCAVVAVSINPADVVAIPSDYNNAKMRVCRYQVERVLEEWDPETNVDPLGGRLIDAPIEPELDVILDQAELEAEDRDGWARHDGAAMPDGVELDDHIDVIDSDPIVAWRPA